MPEKKKSVKATSPSSASPESKHSLKKKEGVKANTFSVAGIGASAGGLDALQKFFGAIPPKTGVAFVVVPHLDPTHKSMMVELLAKHTQMPVLAAEEGMKLQPNQVAVIPPNNFLVVKNRILHLVQPPQLPGHQTAIDTFLRSLAEDVGDSAIGVVLSGTGSHGTLGIQAIKGHGGMTMVQDPDTAGYDSMPQNAIATGSVDFVLPPEKMAAALVSYVQHTNATDLEVPEQEKHNLTRILTLMRARTTYDFRCYRKSMLLRRIQRRMSLNRVENLSEYFELIRDDAGEVHRLLQDLLISVTAFFREPEAYKILEQRVISELIERREDGTPVRVWVPSCATGEEAYSIAIILIEAFLEAEISPRIQLFATDIDERSLEFARQGVYPESISSDISPERLNRFFTKSAHHYHLTKQVREVVTFATQDLIGDAPFSKLDLVSCRNLLIYLEPEVQEKLISIFHFALKPDGCLFLGSSETVGKQAKLFEPISKKWRVFRRIGSTRRDHLEFPIQSSYRRESRVQASGGGTGSSSMGFVELLQRLVLEKHSPASALINRHYEILAMQGPLINYLEFPSGEPTRDLLAMARQGLRTKIRAACHKAIRANERVTDSHARVKRDGAYRPCSVTVMPVTEPREAEDLLLVTFEECPELESSETVAEPESTDESVVRQLEYELKATRDDLQGTIEEMESSGEELKASHEELMSLNEELQSSNEELETSKEELQSMNEELTTVNNQLQDKLAELEAANNDLLNLFLNTDIGTVFLDTDLNIRRFTPSAGHLISLIATDIGRPFSVFVANLGDEELLKDAERVLNKLIPIEKKISLSDGRYFTRRIVPYRTQDDHIGGVVITFVDTTEHQKAEQVVRTSEERLSLAVEASSEGIWDCDLREGKVWLNEAYQEHFGAATKPVTELWQWWKDRLHKDDRSRILDSIRTTLDGGENYWRGEYRCLRKDGHYSNVIDRVHIARDADGKAVRFLGAVVDTTEKKKMEAALRRTERMAVLSTLSAGLAHELNNPLSAIVNSIHAARNLIDSESDNDEFNKCLANALSAADRCTDIMHKVRRFLVSKKVQSLRQARDLNQIAERAVEFYSESLELAGGRIELKTDSSIPRIMVNETEIELLLSNLIQNSVQASENPVLITIETKHTPEGIRLSVTDTGEGLVGEALEKAFDPFYSTHHEEGGMGMGLSIAQAIVEDHSGSIRIEGVSGGGTVVEIDLPVPDERVED